MASGNIRRGVVTYGQPSPFPPSFDGNPWAYGFGLFGDVVAAALALAMLLTYVFEVRRQREVSRLLNNMVVQEPMPRWTVMQVYRTGNIAMLLFVVMRALPDALWMLAWGEVSEKVIRVLLLLDLLFDGLALAPFSLAVLCWAWGRQAIPQTLLRHHVGVTGGPPWEIVLRNGRIVLVVLIIAIGVTIGKASG